MHVHRKKLTAQFSLHKIFFTTFTVNFKQKVKNLWEKNL